MMMAYAFEVQPPDLVIIWCYVFVARIIVRQHQLCETLMVPKIEGAHFSVMSLYTLF